MGTIGAARLEFWRSYLRDFVPRPQHRHESYALNACHLALDAAGAGTYGVGAVLFDRDGRVLVEGRNRVYDNGYRSDLHAEMVVMNDYEAVGWPRDRARECTLVTTLEPCPMCMTRLIVAGVGCVLYLADDAIGGMVRRRHSLPATFRAIIRSHGQVWQPADCSEELRTAAFKIWIESRASLGQWLPTDQDPMPTDERAAAS